MFLASSALALGLLHGLGADHLMAIAALSVGSPATFTRMRTFRVALSFAFGHAMLLAAGTTLVVIAGWTIPILVDRVGEIAGGCILIALGLAGLWMAVTRRFYGHVHPQTSALASGLPARWHLHLGSGKHDPQSHRHSPLPALLGAVFAISGLRAVTLLTPLGAHSGSFVALLGLILIFAIGILLSMSLFGIVLAGSLGAPRVAAWAGQATAVITSAGSVGLGAFWVFWRA
jgi:nickel/cobalt exporter